MTTAVGKTDRAKARIKPEAITIALLLLIVGAAVYSITQDMTRQAQFGPVCEARGQVVTDTGPGAQPKCLDVKTGLMYVPPELRNR